MDPQLLNLLQNLKIDESTIESCMSFLFQSSLSEEQYENIIDICNDKLEEIKLKKNVETINNKINEFKDSILPNPELIELAEFLNDVYKIKAYMNDQNDITEKNPSIEYVIEMNYQKENLTFFYTNIYDNINQTIIVDKCITVEPEKEDSDESDKMSDDGSDDNDESMEHLVKFDENAVDNFLIKMNWNESLKSSFTNMLNNIFSVFESDIEFHW